MDFPLHQISEEPDETKVIRGTQVGHLKAIRAKRAHCLWNHTNTPPHVSAIYVHLCFVH